MCCIAIVEVGLHVYMGAQKNGGPVQVPIWNMATDGPASSAPKMAEFPQCERQLTVDTITIGALGLMKKKGCC